MFKKCEFQLALKIKLLVAKERTLSYLYSNPINQKKKQKKQKKKQTNWCHVLMVKNTIIMEQIIGVKAFCVHTHTHTHIYIYILVVINII